MRAEIATLTAALTAANGRVDELEAAPAPAAPSNEEDKAEIARLRGELANHMERAQVAEERVTTLEADVLAAEQGVRALPVDDAGSGSDEMTAPEREPVELPRAEAPAAATPEPRVAVAVHECRGRFPCAWAERRRTIERLGDAGRPTARDA